MPMTAKAFFFFNEAIYQGQRKQVEANVLSPHGSSSPPLTCWLLAAGKGHRGHSCWGVTVLPCPSVLMGAGSPFHSHTGSPKDQTVQGLAAPGWSQRATPPLEEPGKHELIKAGADSFGCGGCWGTFLRHNQKPKGQDRQNPSAIQGHFSEAGSERRNKNRVCPQPPVAAVNFIGSQIVPLRSPLWDLKALVVAGHQIWSMKRFTVRQCNWEATSLSALLLQAFSCSKTSASFTPVGLELPPGGQNL